MFVIISPNNIQNLPHLLKTYYQSLFLDKSVKIDRNDLFDIRNFVFTENKIGVLLKKGKYPTFINEQNLILIFEINIYSGLFNPELDQVLIEKTRKIIPSFTRTESFSERNKKQDIYSQLISRISLDSVSLPYDVSKEISNYIVENEYSDTIIWVDHNHHPDHIFMINNEWFYSHNEDVDDINSVHQKIDFKELENDDHEMYHYMSVKWNKIRILFFNFRNIILTQGRQHKYYYTSTILSRYNMSPPPLVETLILGENITDGMNEQERVNMSFGNIFPGQWISVKYLVWLTLLELPVSIDEILYTFPNLEKITISRKALNYFYHSNNNLYKQIWLHVKEFHVIEDLEKNMYDYDTVNMNFCKSYSHQKQKENFKKVHIQYTNTIF